jgi:putative transposase
MPRQPRLDVPGTLHHIIVRGIERRRIVDDDGDRNEFIERVAALSTDLETSIYAWALMKNHVHMLLRSGPGGLPNFMGKLLTGYAVFYNKRHKRHGHLFQNRYKSIVCEEDSYFRELVRYIHLNPLRGDLVDDMRALDAYEWCGHASIVGNRRHEWQDTGYVLAWFGDSTKEAKKNYQKFVEKGVPLGRQPQLVGGGLIRSMGGWSQVKALRRMGDRQASDERILGSGEFVKHITAELDLKKKYRVTSQDREEKVEKAIQAVCKERDISINALQNGSRMRNISQARKTLSLKLVDEYGLTFAETARQLGVSTTAVAKILYKKKQKLNE